MDKIELAVQLDIQEVAFDDSARSLWQEGSMGPTMFAKDFADRIQTLLKEASEEMA